MLFLFAVVWPVDLLLQYDLAEHGAVIDARVLETSTGRAKSGQTIYYAEVQYTVGGSVHRPVLSGPEQKIGDTVPVRYSPLFPRYASFASMPAEPPARVTIVMRLLFGSFFSIIAIFVLRRKNYVA